MLQLNLQGFIRKVTTKDVAHTKVSRLFKCVQNKRKLGSRACQDL